MKKVLVLLTLLIAGFLGNSQDYDWGVGARGGVIASGLTGKYFLEPDKAVEGVLTRKGGANLTGTLLTALYEIHKPFHARTLSITSLSWYYGFGAHAGSFSRVGLSTGFSTIGVNGVFGLEYIIETIPFSLSLDVMPTWSSASEFYDNNLFDISFSLRYIMK
jgi:hypothetical protein